MVKYIFTISTGRTGTKYLAKILNLASDIVALHEPAPVMKGKAMFQFLKGDQKLMIEKMPQKIKAIKRNSGERVYFESNHCFIKGFGWLLPEHIAQEEIGVIIMKRPYEKIASSYQKKRTSPLKKSGRDWLITPEMKDKINKFTPLEKMVYYAFKYYYLIYRNLRKIFNFRKSKLVEKYDYKLLKWYAKETYDQGEKFQRTFPDIKYFEMRMKDLNSLDKINEMLSYFGIETDFDEKVESMIGVPANTWKQNNSQ